MDEDETLDELIRRALEAPRIDPKDEKAIREWAERLAADACHPDALGGP